MTEALASSSSAAEMSVLGSAMLDADVLADLASTATEEMFYFTPNKILLRCFRRLWSEGKSLDALLILEDLKENGELEEVGGIAYLHEVMDTAVPRDEVHSHLQIVREKFAIREVLQIAEGMSKAVEAGKRPGKIVARALTRLTSVIDLSQPQQRLKTREDFVAHELARMDKPQGSGISLPFEKISRFTGDLIPGDAVAIPGYSNSGKTLFAANLARHWAISHFPSIWFPTESQEKFLGRVAACHARVPQRYPERDAWHEASPDHREAFEFALRDLKSCPWEIVPQRRISTDEIIAQATVRRRQYDGLPVVIVVDHMHRLNYGNRQMSFAVSEDTQRLRDWAGEDRHGGIILVLLYQPKKPEVDINVYKPVLGYGISGTGQVMAELDLIVSPYRRWVKTSPEADNNPLHRTPWGTARCLYKGNFPEYTKPESENSKVDDEHVYVKIGKRRTGGEGPTVILNIDAPSGYIYQIESHDAPGKLLTARG